MLSQQGSAGGVGGQGFVGPSGGRPMQPQGPSTQQLRMLVQQIQMAVQAGYLNHQVLNLVCITCTSMTKKKKITSVVYYIICVKFTPLNADEFCLDFSDLKPTSCPSNASLT